MNLIDKIEASQMKKDVPAFRVGDTLKVYFRVKEGEKTRTQLFEGVCTRKRGRGLGATCTLVKEAYGDTVEKTFPIYLPTIDKVQVVKKAKVRRAKLYYLKTKSAREIRKKTKVQIEKVAS